MARRYDEEFNDEFVNYKTDEREDFDDDSTIVDTILNGKDIEITSYNLSILRYMKDSNIEYPISNILDDYISELILVSELYEMSDEEYDRYYMRPDLFAYDKYGYIDLDFVVLALNKMNKDTEFTRRTVKFIDRERLFQFISLILDALPFFFILLSISLNISRPINLLQLSNSLLGLLFDSFFSSVVSK